jgi:hypothetical protein
MHGRLRVIAFVALLLAELRRAASWAVAIANSITIICSWGVEEGIDVT